MNYKVNPNTDLGRILSSSVDYTRNSTPSFNDYQYTFGKNFGYAKANRYLVLIFPNTSVQNATGMRMSVDLVRLATNCKSVTLNEETWFTSEQGDINAGPSRIFPYKRNTNNASGVRLQFNCGADMFEKEFFQYWMRYIQDPYSRTMRYYDDYAKGSEIFIIFLPNSVPNFDEAVQSVFADPAKITGYRLTEAYPYAINMNGGSLNYQQSSEPLFIDVAMMYHEISPLSLAGIPQPNAIKPETESGFPIIDENWSKQILDDSRNGLVRAVNGFVVGSQNARIEFARYQREQEAIAARNRSVLQANILLSQVQGFFGVGFFGNGFNP